MKRRIISVLMSVLMIATLALPAFAAGCSHPSKRIEREITGYSELTKTQHTVHYVDTEYCNACDAPLSTTIASYIENHSMQVLSGKHNSDGTHSWRVTCSGCNYHLSYVVPCSGPPCAMPFSVGDVLM